MMQRSFYESFDVIVVFFPPAFCCDSDSPLESMIVAANRSRLQLHSSGKEQPFFISQLPFKAKCSDWLKEGGVYLR